MKKLASIILLSLFFMIGCQDDSSLLETSNSLSDASSSYNKGRVILPKFISLPEDGTLAKLSDVSEGWTVEQYVREDLAAEIVLEHQYEGGIHGVVKVYVSLKIPTESIDDNMYVTLHVNSNNGVVSFKASVPFDGRAELNVHYSGLDLDDESSYDVNFEYLNDGSFLPVNFKELKFDKSTGTLSMYGGQVRQFTEYGFTTLK